MRLDGSTAARAVPAPKDKTILDEMGIGPQSTATQYCQAIQDFLDDKIGEVQMWSRIKTTR